MAGLDSSVRGDDAIRTRFSSAGVHQGVPSGQQALQVARAGNRVNEIGRSVEQEVRRCGFSVMRDLCGHGIGRTIHEEPSVPNFHDARNPARLTEGLVVTIEPIIAAGGGKGFLQRDGWTVSTADRSLSAHVEHTVVITETAPILLTVA